MVKTLRRYQTQTWSRGWLWPNLKKEKKGATGKNVIKQKTTVKKKRKSDFKRQLTKKGGKKVLKQKA